MNTVAVGVGTARVGVRVGSGVLYVTTIGVFVPAEEPGGTFVSFAAKTVDPSVGAVGVVAAREITGEAFRAAVGVKVATFALISCHDDEEHPATIITPVQNANRTTPRPT